jgi:hypothetical protein
MIVFSLAIFAVMIKNSTRKKKAYSLIKYDEFANSLTIARLILIPVIFTDSFDEVSIC